LIPLWLDDFHLFNDRGILPVDVFQSIRLR
jgi:hypothetical protein